MAFEKICIIGNSVALRTRPPLNFPDNKNYTQILQEKLSGNYLVMNMGFGARTVKEIYRDIDDYVRIFPSYYIINLGVVDASTRDVPRWFNRIVNRKTLNPFISFISLFYSNVIAKFRSPLVKLRGKRSWINERKFTEYFDLIIRTLKKETNADIVILSINIADKRVESSLPGSKQKHEKYNLIMKTIAEKYSYKFIDTNKFLEADDYPDGVHFSKSGHLKVAEKIISAIRTSEE